MKINIRILLYLGEKKTNCLFLQQFSIRNQKLKYFKDTWKEYLGENYKEKLNGI